MTVLDDPGHVGRDVPGHATDDALDHRRSADVLVSRHLPLVTALVDEVRGRIPMAVTAEQVRSAALTGLVRAAASFDSARGLSFRSHAEREMRLSVAQEIRSRAGSGRDGGTRAHGGSPDDRPSAADGHLSAGDEVSTYPTRTAAAADRSDAPDYLAEAIDSLPLPQRTIVEMYFLGGASTGEIADALGTRPAEVEMWRGEALRLLRTAMKASADSARQTDAATVRSRATSLADLARLAQVSALRSQGRPVVAARPVVQEVRRVG